MSNIGNGLAFAATDEVGLLRGGTDEGYGTLASLAAQIAALNGDDTFVSFTDNGDGTYTVVNADGSAGPTFDSGPHTVDTDTDTFMTVSSPDANGVVTFVNADGSAGPSISTGPHTDDTFATFVDNGDGTATITSADGASTITVPLGAAPVDTNVSDVAVEEQIVATGREQRVVVTEDGVTVTSNWVPAPPLTTTYTAPMGGTLAIPAGVAVGDRIVVNGQNGDYETEESTLTGTFYGTHRQPADNALVSAAHSSALIRPNEVLEGRWSGTRWFWVTVPTNARQGAGYREQNNGQYKMTIDGGSNSTAEEGTVLYLPFPFAISNAATVHATFEQWTGINQAEGSAVPATSITRNQVNFGIAGPSSTANNLAYYWTSVEAGSTPPGAFKAVIHNAVRA